MTHLVDTSAILSKPEILSEYKNTAIVKEVLHELDKLKTVPGERGFLARRAIVYLVDNMPPIIDTECEFSSVDQHFIALGKSNKYTFITEDISLYLLLIASGNKVIMPRTSKQFPEAYFELSSTDEVIDRLYKGDCITVDDEAHPIQYGTLTSGIKTCLVRKDRRRVTHIPTRMPSIGCIKKILPRNKDQIFLIDAIYFSDTPLIIAEGKAGTGKTLLATYLGVLGLIEGRYEKIVALQPPLPVGGEDRIGFFKGSKEDKLKNYFGGIQDSLNFLYGKKWEEEVSSIEFESTTLTRGRSYQNTYIILDEAQNTTPLEVLTAITRVGENSKLVMLGDLEQIDTMTEWYKTGMGYALLGMQDSPYMVHIHLDKALRSPLVEDAVNRLPILTYLK